MKVNFLPTCLIFLREPKCAFILFVDVWPICDATARANALGFPEKLTPATCVEVVDISAIAKLHDKRILTVITFLPPEALENAHHVWMHAELL